VNSIGIFEAKTKFTSICEEVVRTGQPVIVSKRGQPIVQVAPLPASMQSERKDVLTAWREWADEHADEGVDFPEVWVLRSKSKSNPLKE